MPEKPGLKRYDHVGLDRGFSQRIRMKQFMRVLAQAAFKEMHQKAEREGLEKGRTLELTKQEKRVLFDKVYWELESRSFFADPQG